MSSFLEIFPTLSNLLHLSSDQDQNLNSSVANTLMSWCLCYIILVELVIRFRFRCGVPSSFVFRQLPLLSSLQKIFRSLRLPPFPEPRPRPSFLRWLFGSFQVLESESRFRTVLSHVTSMFGKSSSQDLGTFPSQLLET